MDCGAVTDDVTKVELVDVVAVVVAVTVLVAKEPVGECSMLFGVLPEFVKLINSV